MNKELMDIAYVIEDIMHARNELIAVKITLFAGEWLIDDALSCGLKGCADNQAGNESNFLEKLTLAYDLGAIDCNQQLAIEQVHMIRNRTPFLVTNDDLDILTMPADKTVVQKGPYAHKMVLATKAMVAMGMLIAAINDSTYLFKQNSDFCD